MKALFVSFLLVCGVSAFAGNGDNTTSPTPAENNTNTVVKQTTKTTKQTKVAKPAEDNEKPQPAVKQTSRVCNSSLDAPGYGIGSYFVEFVHKNNMRLIKLLSDD